MVSVFNITRTTLHHKVKYMVSVFNITRTTLHHKVKYMVSVVNIARTTLQTKNQTISFVSKIVFCSYLVPTSLNKKRVRMYSSSCQIHYKMHVQLLCSVKLNRFLYQHMSLWNYQYNWLRACLLQSQCSWK